jgi:hypothetical protein
MKTTNFKAEQDNNTLVLRTVVILCLNQLIKSQIAISH